METVNRILGWFISIFFFFFGRYVRVGVGWIRDRLKLQGKWWKIYRCYCQKELLMLRFCFFFKFLIWRYIYFLSGFYFCISVKFFRFNLLVLNLLDGCMVCLFFYYYSNCLGIFIWRIRDEYLFIQCSLQIIMLKFDSRRNIKGLFQC